LYDCDFNQMLGLPIETEAHVDTFDIQKLSRRQVVLANHCFGCTAGSGSSCQGSTEK